MIEAYGSLLNSAKNPEVLPDLVIAGPDTLNMRAAFSDQAKQLGISERLHWPGMLSGEVKFGAFRGADAFVLPSHQENFGLVVAEALACDVPVLTTDKVNIWRAVLDSGAGLVEPDTQEGIIRLLSRWMDLGEKGQTKMRQMTRSCYKRHFTISAAAKDLTKALRESVNQKQVRSSQ